MTATERLAESRSLVRVAAPFALRGGAIVVQFSSLVLLSTVMSLPDLSAFFAAIALGSLLGSLTDLGVITHSLRYLLRGASLAGVISRTTGIAVATLPMALLIGFVVAPLANLDRRSVVLATVVQAAGRMSATNRVWTLSQGWLTRTSAIDALQPLAFFAFVVGVILAGETLSVSTAILLMLASFLAALVLGALTGETVDAWIDGLRGAFTRPDRTEMRKSWRYSVSGMPVMISDSLQGFWIGVPVILANAIGQSETAASLGFYARILAALNIVAGIYFSFAIHRYYSRGVDRRSEIVRIARSALVLAAAAAIGAFAITSLAPWLPPAVVGHESYALLFMLGSHEAALATGVAGFWVVVGLLTLLIGQNLIWQRVAAMLAGIAVVTIASQGPRSLGWLSGQDAALALWAFAISTLAVIACVLYMLGRKAGPR